MPEIQARHVVLGAGAMGAATAYHLARRGEPVLLIEQFALGHDRGSSHGAARITRHSYADPRYARLMRDAFDAWRQLEADAGQNLYLRTGGLSFCPPGIDYVARVATSLQEIGVAHRRMTGAELNRALPVFRVADETDVVFEPDAGMLAASRAIRAEIDLARQFGKDRFQILENCPVRRIDLQADRPTLVTDSGAIVAERLVVTAGAWTQRLVPDWPVPLRATRQQVLYFRPPDPLRFAPGRFPVFICKGAGDLDDYYGMPMSEGLGLKVARHGGSDTDPDTPDPVVGDLYRSTVREFLRTCLPDVAAAPIELAEVCLYNVAPEEQFQIASPGGRSDVVVASPCSGHGFKFSCLIGRVLADLTTGGVTAIPIDAWKPVRS